MFPNSERMSRGEKEKWWHLFHGLVPLASFRGRIFIYLFVVLCCVLFLSKTAVKREVFQLLRHFPAGASVWFSQWVFPGCTSWPVWSVRSCCQLSRLCCAAVTSSPQLSVVYNSKGWFLTYPSRAGRGRSDRLGLSGIRLRDAP